MPYRIDIPDQSADAFGTLIDLGALDLEATADGLAAILPDSVSPEAIAAALGVSNLNVSDATGRDNGSVWLLSSRAIRIGGLSIVSPESPASPKTLRLANSDAFGTGHHPTTALCIEIIEEILLSERIDRALDVGTGSGILALVALAMGVPEAVGVDTDPSALEAAAENARLNVMADRLQLSLGGPEVAQGTWPLVIANVLAAPLIEMAPVLVQRVGSGGRLIISGVASSLESEVRDAYEHFGMRKVHSKTRSGWTALLMQASW